jgi:hypothetical protein
MSDNGNGNGKLDNSELEALNQFIHSGDSTDKAFKSQDTLNALRLMVMSDPEFIDNAMRLDTPSMAFILGLAVSVQQCKAHNFKDGEDFLKLLTSLLPSRHGKRIDQLIAAISGEKQWQQSGQGSGLMDKIKKASGLS